MRSLYRKIALTVLLNNPPLTLAGSSESALLAVTVDGRRAIIVQRTVGGKTLRRTSILRVRPGSAKSVSLMTSNGLLFDAVLSPDGTRIAFARLNDATSRRTNIFVTDITG